MTEFPPNASDFVIGAEPERHTKRILITVDGEILNVFREHGFGGDLCRLYLQNALVAEFGQKLHIKILSALTGRHIPELPRTRGQIRREQRQAMLWGWDWLPPGPLDEGANPLVKIGGGDG